MKELNEKTELEVSYRPIKAGNSVKKLLFTIDDKTKSWKTKEKQDDISDDEKFDIMFKIKSLLGEQFDSKAVCAIADAAGYDFEKVKAAYEVYKDSAGVKSPVAWMISAIRDGYKTPSSSKKSGFDSFEQRETDYEELEDILIER